VTDIVQEEVSKRLAYMDENQAEKKQEAGADSRARVSPLSASKKHAPGKSSGLPDTTPLAPPPAPLSELDNAIDDIDVVRHAEASTKVFYSNSFNRSFDRLMKKADTDTLHDFLRVAWGEESVGKKAQALSDLLAREGIVTTDGDTDQDSLMFLMGTKFISPAARLREKIVDALDLPRYLKMRYESINRNSQMDAETRQASMRLFLDRLGRGKALFDRYPDMETSEALAKLAYINHFDIEVDDDFARALDPMDEPDFNSPGYVSKMRAHTESLKMRTGLTDWLVTLLPVQFQKNYEVFVTEFGMPMPGVEQELIKLLQAELPDAKRI
jgi:hypothetical protein